MRFLVLAIILGGIFYAPIVGAIEKGAHAHSFSLPSLEGRLISLADYKASVIYLDFWASWCGPCKRSLPWMNELQKKYAYGDLHIIAINLDTERTAALKMLESINPEFLVLFDPAGNIAELYQLEAMPSSFLIDRSGRIILKIMGFNDRDKQEVEDHITRLVSEG